MRASAAIVNDSGARCFSFVSLCFEAHGMVARTLRRAAVYLLQPVFMLRYHIAKVHSINHSLGRAAKLATLLCGRLYYKQMPRNRGSVPVSMSRAEGSR